MTAPTAIIRALPIASIIAASNIRISNGHDKESLNQLAESIKTHGLIQPIVVRPANADEIASGAGFAMIAGRRRLAASKLAGLDTIPAIVSNTDEADAYQLEIAENIQREQMTLSDTARAVRTLMLIHDNAKAVASIVNKSAAWVSKHLTITANTFAPTIAELLDRNIVGDLETLLLLNQIAKLPATTPKASDTLKRLLTIAHAGDMNRQTARDALAALKTPKPMTPPSTPDDHTADDAQDSLDLGQKPEPEAVFHLTLPVSVLEEYKARCGKGGTHWLRDMLSAGQGPYGTSHA